LVVEVEDPEPESLLELVVEPSADSVDELAVVDSVDELAVAVSPASLFSLEVLRAADRRSFFAQPEPLKWIAGGAKALRTGPLPHNGQVLGPSSWTPWITSNRRPQAAQS